MEEEMANNTKNIMNNFKNEQQNNFDRIEVLDNPKRTLPCGWNVALKEVW